MFVNLHYSTYYTQLTLHFSITKQHSTINTRLYFHKTQTQLDIKKHYRAAKPTTYLLQTTKHSATGNIANQAKQNTLLDCKQAVLYKRVSRYSLKIIAVHVCKVLENLLFFYILMFEFQQKELYLIKQYI